MISTAVQQRQASPQANGSKPTTSLASKNHQPARGGPARPSQHLPVPRGGTPASVHGKVSAPAGVLQAASWEEGGSQVRRVGG